MGTPSDSAGWLELIRTGMPPFWRALAEGAGGSVWAEDDVLAAIVPMAPERSVFNSVFYEDGERLLVSLDPIADAYDEAGVNAWTVWVPEADDRAAAGLGEAGHVLDAEPRAMGMEISALQAPEPDETIEFRDELDMPEVARLNEIAYGWPPGDFAAVAQAEVPNTYAHFASLDGDTLGTVVTWDHGGDSEILWVATLPEARGRGISKQLMARAITAAGERGRLTTTLIATKLGRPVYERIGYRDFGAIQMWERRKAG
jgi:GNAT superfamily N-acetyltransferase